MLFKRRKALEEAMKTVHPNKTDCEELLKLRKELNIPPVNTEIWLNLPRIFTRSSARFELPMDSRTLSSMYEILLHMYTVQNQSVGIKEEISEQKIIFC